MAFATHLTLTLLGLKIVHHHNYGLYIYPPYHALPPYTPSSPEVRFQSSMYAENMNVYPNSGGAPSFELSECFGLLFLKGTRIRMCYGCSNPIRTDTSVVPPPPHNIVIAYKKRRWYWDLHAQLMKLIATAKNK